MKHPEDLHVMQEGAVGDMTASHRVKDLSVPLEEARRMKEMGQEVPFKMANCLYLEWFSQANGRVVLETVDFRITELSEPEWRMTPDEEYEQRASNVEAIKDFIQRLDQAIEQRRSEWSPDDDKAMDEFEWENFLRESDQRTERYGEVIEKHQGHPEAEKLIAREMGWDWLDDAMDADERGAFKEDRSDMEEIPPLEPIPESEGVDWIRTDEGTVRHPLAYRAAEASVRLWRECDALGLLGQGGDEDVADMAFQGHMISAKLAGALNGLAYREEPDAGFVVAYLKRALKFFDTTMAAIRKVEERQVIESSLLQKHRQEFFEIREEILKLMNRYRQQTP